VCRTLNALSHAQRCWSRGQQQATTGTENGRYPTILSCIGNTPLITIPFLSVATGCTILGKCEMLNPGGSIKDRVALRAVAEAASRGALRRGGVVTEGTAGSTGIALAMVAAAHGYRCAHTL
jgi:cysteine synthase